MLILTRHVNEAVELTGAVTGTVTVTKIKGDKVSLGFDFPVEVEIQRDNAERDDHEKE